MNRFKTVFWTGRITPTHLSGRAQYAGPPYSKLPKFDSRLPLVELSTAGVWPDPLFRAFRTNAAQKSNFRVEHECARAQLAQALRSDAPRISRALNIIQKTPIASTWEHFDQSWLFLDRLLKKKNTLNAERILETQRNMAFKLAAKLSAKAATGK